MSIKPTELEINSENPFENCKLGRQKYAHILTDLVNAYSEGFVLAINNKWGTGKTTFVKMWEQDLRNNNYQTVYFNAWENDFENNPLTALMGELKSLTTVSTEPTYKNALKNAAILSKHITPIVVQAIADKYIDTQGVRDAVQALTKGFTDVFENDVNEYAKKKKSISEFRNSLSEFIANTNDGKPLIFIVDELDRCRPDYAVSILEQIKHFFSVSCIVFVLSIDKIQLGNAVRGVYGSDQIDADEYLRRFIDVEYSIPEPEKDLFIKHLFYYFNFESFFYSADRRTHPELKSDKKIFLEICNVLFTSVKISLRQQEKVFALARLALRTIPQNHYVIPSVYFFMTFIKLINNDLYENLKSKRLSFIELQEKFLEIVKSNNNKQTENELIRLEGYLLLYYNNYLNSEYDNYNTDKLYERDSSTSKIKLKISSIINKQDQSKLEFFFDSVNRHGSNEGYLELSYFFNKLDLFEKINF